MAGEHSDARATDRLRWLQHAVAYELVPATFADGSGDGYGDLAGVRDRLDYLAALGVNLLVLGPVFPAAGRHGNWDITDPLAVEARLGGAEALSALIDAAHERDIRVALDVLVGHLSIDSALFQQAQQASAAAQRFIWHPDPYHQEAAGIRFTPASATLGSYGWVTHPGQARLNYGFARVSETWQASLSDPGPSANRQALEALLSHWLESGVDALRVLDPAALVAADPDATANRHLWRTITSSIRSRFPDRALLACWGQPELAADAGFDLDLDAGHSGSGQALLYGPAGYFRRPRTDFSAFERRFQWQYRRCDDSCLIAIPTGGAAIGRLQADPGAQLPEARLKLAFGFMLTWPQLPWLYYGEEIGMRAVPGMDAPGGPFAGSAGRAMMMWEPGPDGGFSSVKPDPALPQDTHADRPDVATLRADRNGLWHHVERLIYLRSTEADLAPAAELALLECPAKSGALLYRRGAHLLVALNPGLATETLDLPPLGDVVPVLQQNCQLQSADGGWRVRLNQAGFGIYSTR